MYSGGPLLFNIDVDPSEAHPLSVNTTAHDDPAIAAVLEQIMQAYAKEVASVVPHASQPAPDGPGEKPGEYGICCNRTLGCDCDGPPSSVV